MQEELQLHQKEQVQKTISRQGWNYTNLQNLGYDYNNLVNTVPNDFNQVYQRRWHTDPYNYNYSYHHYNDSNAWASSQYASPHLQQQSLQNPVVQTSVSPILVYVIIIT